MDYIAIVTVVALLQYVFFAAAVGRARGQYGVKAPAVTGHEVFERYFRVQMNTLELLVVLVPSLWLFGHYVSPLWGAALGAVYIVGRVLYFSSYVRDPAKRELGFALSVLPALALAIGALVGAIARLV
jgi:glutathione S-transferase